MLAIFLGTPNLDHFRSGEGLDDSDDRGKTYENIGSGLQVIALAWAIKQQNGVTELRSRALRDGGIFVQLTQGSAH